MRAFLTVLFLLPFVIAGPALANSRETVANAVPVTPIESTNAPVWAGPAGGVLHDNGPLVTHPNGGFNGANASALQTALGMGTYGFGHQILNDNRIADDFTVPVGDTWDINSITFFAYQTGSSTTSTMNAVHFEIWDGVPLASNLVFGDMVTNRLVATSWSGTYRVLDTNLTDSARPIMANVCSPMGPLQLGAGTYWIAWQTGGTLTSGPWAPPVSILGQTTTGNGMQSLIGAAYAPVLDVGGQAFPFIIEGSNGPVSVDNSTWAQLKTLYR
jgi:hypothetical protein